MLERVAQSRPPSPRRARPSGFAAIFKRGVFLPKTRNLCYRCCCWSHSLGLGLLGAGMKPVCYLTRLDRNPRREFRKREIFLFFSLVTFEKARFGKAYESK
jgi:hypothetical protein